jgi:hypothetical protein
MLEIQEHIATEELLKMYFFKLYERKNEFADLYFLEDRLNVIINCKTLSQMNSKELFECININNRWGMKDVVDGAFVIPSKFYLQNPLLKVFTVLYLKAVLFFGRKFYNL